MQAQFEQGWRHWGGLGGQEPPPQIYRAPPSALQFLKNFKRCRHFHNFHFQIPLLHRHLSELELRQRKWCYVTALRVVAWIGNPLFCVPVPTSLKNNDEGNSLNVRYKTLLGCNDEDLGHGQHLASIIDFGILNLYQRLSAVTMGRNSRKMLKCLVCQEEYKSDYRNEHNRKYHHDLFEKRKPIPFCQAGQVVVSNPFAAAASAAKKNKRLAEKAIDDEFGNPSRKKTKTTKGAECDTSFESNTVTGDIANNDNACFPTETNADTSASIDDASTSKVYFCLFIALIYLSRIFRVSYRGSGEQGNMPKTIGEQGTNKICTGSKGTIGLLPGIKEHCKSCFWIAKPE